MAAIKLDGQPIFVDVENEPQFPILYAQLLGSDDGSTVPNEAPKSNTNTADTEAAPAKHNQPENKTETQTQQTECMNACIKIENRKLKCPECKRFTCETEEKMLRHIRRVHRGENPFQCYMCEYSTYNKAVFEEHVRVHQGIKPFKCSYCDYRSASKKNTKKHELRHRADNPLKCTDCDFIANNSQSFQCHKRKEHGLKVKENVDAAYNCKICKRTFETRKQKINHYKLKRQCPKCAYVTCTKMLYDTHLQLDHGIKTLKKDLPKLFTCSLCPWSSNSKPRILLHLIHHPNQTVNEDDIDITVLRDCGIME